LQKVKPLIFFKDDEIFKDYSRKTKSKRIRNENEAQNLLGCTAVFLLEHGSTSQKILSFILAAVRT
jgi:hypothetical protein